MVVHCCGKVEATYTSTDMIEIRTKTIVSWLGGIDEVARAISALVGKILDVLPLGWRLDEVVVDREREVIKIYLTELESPGIFAVIVAIIPIVGYFLVASGVIILGYSYYNLKTEEKKLEVSVEKNEAAKVIIDAAREGIITRETAQILLKENEKAATKSLLDDPIKLVQYTVIGVGGLIILKDVLVPTLKKGG